MLPVSASICPFACAATYTVALAQTLDRLDTGKTGARPAWMGLSTRRV
ncbi:hypothetical protein TRIP_B200149 [uncultured Desulfatiglans sp.]|nr:hypothetical protein TRIP_B200149 [uncultured Desulfatiglans sp.]